MTKKKIRFKKRFLVFKMKENKNNFFFENTRDFFFLLKNNFFFIATSKNQD